VFSLTLFVLGIVVYAIVNFEPVSRRLEALPYYARTYVNKVRPKPALPTPPAVSVVDAETLLQTRLEATPRPESQVPQTDLAETVTPGAEASDQEGVPGRPGARLVESSVTQVLPIAPEVYLAGFEHEWQTWNNRGLAHEAMNQPQAAAQDHQATLAYNPKFSLTARALADLEAKN
jgi:hypothetical protein